MSIHSETVNGYTVEIHQDEEGGPNPRTDHDNLGTMVCFHKRYELGDAHGKSAPSEAKIDIERAQEIERSDKYLSLPIYMYDHSGITINTTGFSCPWDSGRLGLIFLSIEKLIKEYGSDTPENRATAQRVLLAEVNEYDSYLRGEVYGFKILDADGEEVDSCWGFIGDMKYCLEEAKGAAEHLPTQPKQLELQLGSNQ